MSALVPKPKRGAIDCPECHGGGISYYDPKASPNYTIDRMNAHICTKCHGSGWVWKKGKRR